MKYPAKNNSTKLMKTVNILSETLWSIRLPIYDAITLINPIAVEDFVVVQTLPLLIILTLVTFGLIRIPLNRLSGSLLFAFFLFFIYQLTLI